jgi:hypothetical protein
LLVGEGTGLELGVDQFPVGFQFKASAAGWYQLQPADLLFVTGEEFGRQTDGLRFVPSHGAIGEFQFHCSSPERIQDLFICYGRSREREINGELGTRNVKHGFIPVPRSPFPVPRGCIWSWVTRSR